MKFEEHIKDKLNKRSIAPSPAAWERVAAQLQHNKPSKNRYLWPKMAIAAGFMGILILGASLFFTAEKSATVPIVDVPQHINTDQNQLTTSEDESKKNIQKPISKPKKRAEKPNFSLKNPENPIAEQTLPKKEENQRGTPDFDTSEKPAEGSKNLVPAVKKSVDAEVNRLLAAVTIAEEKGNQVSDATIDSLLAQAREKIVNDHIYEEQTQRVSATALLQAVENELEQSFRDRVFDALKEGFLRAREAVVSRND